MQLPLEGGCLCGAVRYRVTAEPVDSVYCHCRMCQRRSGAPAVATVEVPTGGLAFVQGEPAAYRSSPEAQRLFCRDCGTELYFTLLHEPTSLSLNLGTLDDPEAVRPTKHIWTSSQVSWFVVDDGLPRHGENAPEDEPRP